MRTTRLARSGPLDDAHFTIQQRAASPWGNY
jgi:hypothetical protein